ncbi:MAG: hypothetical protein QX198_09860 [Methylococcaceae bacterium]
MNEDRYPFNYLWKRLFDMVLFCSAVVFLIIAVIIGVYSDHSEQRYVIGLGMTASAIGAFIDHRQKTIYENDYIEFSLLTDSLQVKYLNRIARLRHKAISSNVWLVVTGIFVAGYGVVWGAS